MTSTFCADPALSNGPIVLINILADSLNYGYNGRPWRVLESLNGRKISTMDQLCETCRLILKLNQASHSTISMSHLCCYSMTHL